MKQYKELIDNILSFGESKLDRTGAGTKSLFGTQLKFNLYQGFPLVTIREINWRAAFGELAGFLTGATTSQEFRDFGCNYWNSFGEDLGPIYGAQWRDFNGVDQLDDLMTGLSMTPYSRRHVLSTWNPADLSKMVLPPCHIIAQFNVVGKALDCIVYMRSVDVMLGLPYDITIYALLTHLIAYELGLNPRELTFFMGDTHIYNNHIAGAYYLMSLEPQDLPSLQLSPEASVFGFDPKDANVVFYMPHPKYNFELNV